MDNWSFKDHHTCGFLLRKIFVFLRENKHDNKKCFIFLTETSEFDWEKKKTMKRLKEISDSLKEWSRTNKYTLDQFIDYFQNSNKKGQHTFFNCRDCFNNHREQLEWRPIKTHKKK